jgi:hypothetical protein
MISGSIPTRIITGARGGNIPIITVITRRRRFTGVHLLLINRRPGRRNPGLGRGWSLKERGNMNESDVLHNPGGLS